MTDISNNRLIVELRQLILGTARGYLDKNIGSIFKRLGVLMTKQQEMFDTINELYNIALVLRDHTVEPNKVTEWMVVVGDYIIMRSTDYEMIVTAYDTAVSNGNSPEIISIGGILK